MARRRDGVLNVLSELPWYVNLVFAVALYFGAPSIASRMASSSLLLSQSQQTVVFILRLVSFVYLFVAVLSAIRGCLVLRKLSLQRSLADLRALTWQQFETIVGAAYRCRGYSVIETGQGGADGGVDLVLKKDGKRYLVQCKRYREATVGVTVVREIFGVVAAQGASGAIVVTTGSFTKEAIAFARSLPIDLIDGLALEAMVREINDVAALIPVEAATTPASSRCPTCGGPMVQRAPRKGGAMFLGCSAFPKCRGTRSL